MTMILGIAVLVIVCLLVAKGMKQYQENENENEKMWEEWNAQRTEFVWTPDDGIGEIQLHNGVTVSSSRAILLFYQLLKELDDDIGRREEERHDAIGLYQLRNYQSAQKKLFTIAMHARQSTVKKNMYLLHDKEFNPAGEEDMNILKACTQIMNTEVHLRNPFNGALHVPPKYCEED